MRRRDALRAMLGLALVPSLVEKIVVERRLRFQSSRQLVVADRSTMEGFNRLMREVYSQPLYDATLLDFAEVAS